MNVVTYLIQQRRKATRAKWTEFPITPLDVVEINMLWGGVWGMRLHTMMTGGLEALRAFENRHVAFLFK